MFLFFLWVFFFLAEKGSGKFKVCQVCQVCVSMCVIVFYSRYSMSYTSGQ